jgi:hypothetical protein
MGPSQLSAESEKDKGLQLEGGERNRAETLLPPSGDFGCTRRIRWELNLDLIRL